jgi:hypothetical protein
VCGGGDQWRLKVAGEERIVRRGRNSTVNAWTRPSISIFKYVLNVAMWRGKKMQEGKWGKEGK